MTSIIPTCELRIGDILLDSFTNDPEHPMIFDVVKGFAASAPTSSVVQIYTERHAYGRVVRDEHFWSGVRAEHTVLGRLDPETGRWLEA